jgi:hypothetical protein
MQHEPHPGAGVVEIHREVPGLLRHPGLDRVLRDAENADPAATVLAWQDELPVPGLVLLAGLQRGVLRDVAGQLRGGYRRLRR